MSTPSVQKYCLFGASADTGNLGVTALMHSTVAAIARRRPDAEVTVFDNGWGVRMGSVPFGDGEFPVRLCGARLSKRFHRPESYFHMRLSGWLGGLGNPGIRAIAEADAALDVSGGDSFSDIYGLKRFRSITLPKRIVLEQGTPLILLPQTYGPFAQAQTRDVASSIVRKASMAWARDAFSFDILQDLLGDEFDHDKHRLGVDMAFALERNRPAEEKLEGLIDWLDEAGEHPVAGVNVSGLIYNDDGAAEQYGIKVDYRQVIMRLVMRLIEDGARVLLVSHVLAPEGEIESDLGACRDVLNSLPESVRDRVRVTPAGIDACQAKWIISRLSWFSGTRMHSTIAGLSTGVPTSAIAYSDKTEPVFATCGQEERVADPRCLGTDDVVDLLWNSWLERDAIRADLAKHLPRVLELVQSQVDTILDAAQRRVNS